MLDSWLNWIADNHVNAVKLGLDKLRPIVDKLELNNFDCPVITVGGTNGKGSTIKYIEQMSLLHGLKVGTYTSPHLLKFNERISLNGTSVSDEKIVAAFEAIKPYSANLTFFEFITISALYLFKLEPLDVLILEIGLGGRLDAVNVVDSDIAILTNVDLDHKEFLGDTRERVAYEKSHIFRKNKLALYGDIYPVTTVFEVADNLGADLQLFNRDYSYDGLSSNKASSIRAFEELGKLLEFKLEEELIQQALGTKLLGRFTTVNAHGVEFILDVAHNVASVKLLMDNLQSLPKKLTGVIFACQKTKDLAMLDSCKDLASIWQVLELKKAQNAWCSKALAEVVKEKVKAEVEEAEVETCVARLKDIGVDRVVVFGSFYTVAEVLNELH